MPVQRDEPVQLIAQEQVRLFAELRKLPDASWSRPSHHEPWTVAQVVAHLALGAQFFQQSIGRALRGDCHPPALPGGQRMTSETFVERLNTRQEELAKKPRSEILAVFDKTGSELVDLLRRVAPHNMTRPAWHPEKTWTIAMFVSMRVFDLAFHGWDIHVALDPAAVIRLQLQPFLLHLQLQFERRLFSGGPELDGVYRFDLGSQAWTTRVFAGKMSHGPLEPGPDAIIKTDANSFLLLSTCRQSMSSLESRGLLKLEGDRERAQGMLAAICRSPAMTQGRNESEE
ncbi:MAG: maleylpyruvate isomerase family mycothiol-dependent enzyme [Chloroflexota bacterium]|nr:maleylpyruvate isomerase family mycothiol-dependent enzyme [Chloroflexota bacterium]